jgi:hypothetical protein
MMEAPSISELYELYGVALPFSLTRRSDTISGDMNEFRKILFRDQGGSVVGVLPDALSARVDEIDPAQIPGCFRRSGITIVSSALREIVESFDVPCIEFFPVKLELLEEGGDFEKAPTGPGEIIEGYWLMNCWNRIDVVDLEHSDLVWQKSFVGHRPPWFVGWKRLVLKAPIEADLYGFAENMPRRRYVSPRLREAIRAAKLQAGVHARPLLRPN